MGIIDLSALVLAAQTGDADAMNDLINQCYQDLFFHAYQTVKDEDLAADITQESCIEILTTLEKLREPAAFTVWSRRIVYHQCTRYFRQNREEVALEENEDGETILDRLPDDNPENLPEKVQEDKEFQQTMQKMLDALPAEQRSALMLYYYEKLSVGQIAQIQAVSEGTVKSRLNYGRKAVKEKVEAYEKKTGVRLHSAAPLPLLLLFLFGQQKHMLAPAMAKVGSILAAGGATTGVTAAAGVGTGLSLAAKIGIAVTAVVASVGVVAGGIILAGQDNLPNGATEAPTVPVESMVIPQQPETPAVDADLGGWEILLGEWSHARDLENVLELRADGTAVYQERTYLWDSSYSFEPEMPTIVLTDSVGNEELYMRFWQLDDGRYSFSLYELLDNPEEPVDVIKMESQYFFRLADYEGYTLVKLTPDNILDYVQIHQQLVMETDLEGRTNPFWRRLVTFREGLGSASFCVADFIYEVQWTRVRVDEEGNIAEVVDAFGHISQKKDSDSVLNSAFTNLTIVGLPGYRGTDTGTQGTDSNGISDVEIYKLIGAQQVDGIVLIPPQA